MKYLKDSFLEKFITTSSIYDARVLHIPAQQVTSLTRDPDEPYVYEDIVLLSLPQNVIQSIEINEIWRSFPSTWWLDLSQNHIVNFDAVTLFPPAIGLLDLHGNKFTCKTFASLGKMYILRLLVENTCFENIVKEGNQLWDGLLTVAGNLPFTWVYNDQFISCLDRSIAFSGGFKVYDHTDNVNGDVFANSWRVLAMNQRQETILQVVHAIQKLNTRSDQVKLDILLEDYIQYAMIFNEYMRQLKIANNAAVKHVKTIPILSNIDVLLYIPHRQRLDLSVLLTISIIFPIPSALLRDALTILLVSYLSATDVEAMVELPAYIKTAVVSMICRITKKEYDEIHANKCLKIKPQRSSLEIASWIEQGTKNVPIPTYGSQSTDFYYLRILKEYLQMNYARSSDGSNDNTFVPANQTIFFSELELEIMQKLPSCPTKYCAMKELPTPSTDAKAYDIYTNVPLYHSWVSFAARHAIFLLNKAPSCPSLTKLSTNLTQQDLYFDLLPLLKAANMSLVDLDVSTTGPLVDGRAINNPLKATMMATSGSGHGGGDGKKKSKYARRMESAMVLLDGKVLPNGLGLPNASMKSLLWHAEPDSELAKLAAEKYLRNNSKPWLRSSQNPVNNSPPPTGNTVMTDTMADTAANAYEMDGTAVSFFVTEDDMDQGEIHRPGNQSKIRIIPNRGRSPVYQLSHDVGIANYFGERMLTREQDQRPLSPTIMPSPTIRSPSPIQLGTAGFTSQYSSLWNGSKDDVPMIAPELYPPEFRPHSRLGSAKTLLNRLGSPYDLNRSNDNPGTRDSQYIKTDFTMEGVTELPPSRAFTPQQGSIAGKSLVSISLPSVQSNSPEASLDGKSIGGSSVMSKGFENAVSASILSKNDDDDDDDEEGLLFQPYPTSKPGTAPAVKEEGSKLLTLESAASSHILLALGKDHSQRPFSSKSSKGEIIMDDESINGDIKFVDQGRTMTPKTPSFTAPTFVSPQKTLNSVQIYSADTLPTSQFLVAPHRAVESYNLSYGVTTTGAATMDAESMDNYWRSLDKPPMMLLSNKISPRRSPSPSHRAIANNLDSNLYISPESFKKSKNILSVSGSSKKLSNAMRSQPSSPNGRLQENAFAETMLEEQSIASEITSSVMFAKENNFMEMGDDDDEESFQVLHQEGNDHMTREEVIKAIRDKEKEELNPILVNNQKRQNSSNNSSKKRLQIIDPGDFKDKTMRSAPIISPIQKSSQASAEEAAIELLRDMGTFRNVKQLQRFNHYLSSIRFDANGKAITVTDTSKKDAAGQTLPPNTDDDATVSDDMSSIRMSVAPSPVVKLSFLTGSQQLRQKQAAKQESVPSIPEQSAFLTNVANQEPAFSPPGEIFQQDSPFAQTNGTSLTTNEVYAAGNPYLTIVEQSNRIPTETIRDQKQYPHIYTAERFEDKATYSYVNNAKIGSSAFYPVFHKNMYKMEVPIDAEVPEHLLGYTSRPLSTRPLSSKPIQPPTLLENSILSATPTYLDDETTDGNKIRRASRHPTMSDTSGAVPIKATGNGGTIQLQNNSVQLKHNLKILQSSSRFFKDLIAKESFEVPILVENNRPELIGIGDDSADFALAATSSGILHQNYGDQMNDLPLPSFRVSSPSLDLERQGSGAMVAGHPLTDEIDGHGSQIFDDEMSQTNSIPAKSINGDSVPEGYVMPGVLSIEMRNKHGTKQHHNAAAQGRIQQPKVATVNKVVDSKAVKDKARTIAITNGLIITNGSNQKLKGVEEVVTPRTCSTYSTNQFDSMAIYEAYNSQITQGNSFISNYSNTSGLSSNAKSKANKGNGKPNLKTSATELDLLRKHRAPASNALQINTSQTSPDLLVGGMRSPSGSKPGSPNQGMGTSRSQKSLTSQPHNAFSAAAKQLLNNRNVGQNCKYINPVAKVRRSSTQAQESDDYKRLFMPDPAVNLNDPHRRLFALSASVGSDNQVWVGMQNYKAMTHSVSLNRNFKAKVVPASAKVEVNGEEEEE